MPEVNPKLYKQLSESDLVFVKGDLNYRKLAFDVLWPRTTPFQKAIGRLGQLHGAEGVRILSLGTANADVCVGLKEGLAEKLDKETNGERPTNGKYAVVSFWDGKA